MLMLTQFIVAFLCWMLYLLYDAKQNVIIVQNLAPGKTFNHTAEANRRAICGFSIIACTCVPYYFIRPDTFANAMKWLMVNVSLGFLFMSIGWLAFDMFFNLWRGTPLLQVGTGKIDIFFTNKYGVDAGQRMLGIKCILIIVWALIFVFRLNAALNSYH